MPTPCAKPTLSVPYYSHNLRLTLVNQVHPVVAVEIEVSLWSYDDNQKAVISTARELGIAVLAYSPLGRGALTGTIKSSSELPGMF